MINIKYKKMWNELGISIICDIQTIFESSFNTNDVIYFAHNQMKYSNQFCKIPTIGAIQCVLRRCSELAKATNVHDF